MSVRDMAREGVYRLLHALTGKGRGVRVILLYHSVGGEIAHSVPLPVFEQQINLLTEQFTVVRLTDLPQVMASSPAEANLACVTFDDGYRDNYEVALPILERYGIKATFFIATGFLSKTFRTFAGEVPMMDEMQVRELAARGHDIGAHTVSHPRLTQVTPDLAREEIRRSKEELEGLLEHDIVSFAYPKGAYDRVVRQMVEESGIRVAVTIRQGLLTGSFNWLELPRVWVNSRVDLRGFVARVSPAVEWYRRLRMWQSGAA